MQKACRYSYPVSRISYLQRSSLTAGTSLAQSAIVIATPRLSISAYPHNKTGNGWVVWFYVLAFLLQFFIILNGFSFINLLLITLIYQCRPEYWRKSILCRTSAFSDKVIVIYYQSLKKNIASIIKDDVEVRQPRVIDNFQLLLSDDQRSERSLFSFYHMHNFLVIINWIHYPNRYRIPPAVKLYWTTKTALDSGLQSIIK